MCSDALDFCVPPSPYGSIICKEIKEKFLTSDLEKKYGTFPSNKRPEDELLNFALDIIFVPSCSEKVRDFDLISTLQSGRKYRPTIFSNSSFFGGTKIWGVPIDNISYFEVEQGTSGVVSANIPIPPGKYFLLRPKSISARDKEVEKNMIDNLIKNNINSKKYPIYFDSGNTDRAYNNEIPPLDEEEAITISEPMFEKFVNGRLNKALKYLYGVDILYAKKHGHGSILDQIKDKENLYKELQQEIKNNGTKIKTIDEILIPPLEDLAFGDNIE